MSENKFAGADFVRAPAMPTIGPSRWINEPPAHRQDGDELIVTTGKDTDLWNNTFYGFLHVNGHCHATAVTGDFSFTVTFSASYQTLYEQAGAVLWVDGQNWVKCGVEFTDVGRTFSVVITRDDQSDWSVRPLGGPVDSPVTLRLTRHAEAVRIELLVGGKFELIRLGYLRMGEIVEVGPACCSPLNEGLDVTFHDARIEAPISRELHPS